MSATRLFTAAVALLALPALLAVPSVAFADDGAFTCTKDKPCTLRVRTVAPAASPWGSLLKSLASDIFKDSEGRLKLQVYWQSKSEESAVRQCATGKIGGIAVSNGALASAVPELMATEMPYLFDDYAQADKALNAVVPLLREILAARGFIYGMRGENGFRHFATKDRFIKSPADLAGKSMRAQPAKHHLTMYRSFGATPNPIQVAEVPSSLANNTVTGYDNTLLYADLAGWSSEIKYVSLSGHIYQGALVAWCGKWYERLPADMQQVLVTARPKTEEVGLRLVRLFNDQKMPEKYKKDEIQMHRHTASERAAFRAAVAPVEAEFRRETSAEGRKLLDEMQKNR